MTERTARLKRPVLSRDASEGGRHDSDSPIASTHVRPSGSSIFGPGTPKSARIPTRRKKEFAAVVFNRFVPCRRALCFCPWPTFRVCAFCVASCVASDVASDVVTSRCCSCPPLLFSTEFCSSSASSVVSCRAVVSLPGRKTTTPQRTRKSGENPCLHRPAVVRGCQTIPESLGTERNPVFEKRAADQFDWNQQHGWTRIWAATNARRRTRSRGGEASCFW